jgi:hypothetical protein
MAQNRSTPAQREELLARLSYVGSAHHKRRPGDYGFQPPTNPRATKDLCDAKGQRPILAAEAAQLFADGIRRGMFSAPTANGLPKYVWGVDTHGDVYEAKTRPELEAEYHGYRLGDDESDMRRYVIEEWNRR